MELVFALPAVGALHCVAMAAGGWVMGSDMARRERAAYLVCSAGASVSIAGPLSLALLGPFGAACVFVAGIPAALTSTVGAYTLASSAGPAFPEQVTLRWHPWAMSITPPCRPGSRCDRERIRRHSLSIGLSCGNHRFAVRA